jgi:photoactive yellow protein
MDTLTIHTLELAGDYKGSSMQDSHSPTIPFGLFELDPEGLVVRYSSPAEKNPSVLAKDVIGRNFFTEIVPVEQVIDFRDRFYRFMLSGQSVDKFTARFVYQQQNIKVQIMMAHITEKSEDVRQRLALVRIMPE